MNDPNLTQYIYARSSFFRFSNENRAFIYLFTVSNLLPDNRTNISLKANESIRCINPIINLCVGQNIICWHDRATLYRTADYANQSLPEKYL